MVKYTEMSPEVYFSKLYRNGCETMSLLGWHSWQSFKKSVLPTMMEVKGCVRQDSRGGYLFRTSLVEKAYNKYLDKINQI